MNRRSFVQLVGGAALSPKLWSEKQEAGTTEDLRLWYDRPAANWDEALPIGCGRLGAMIFGGPGDELLQLNEDTLYSEEPGTGNLPLDTGPDFERIEHLLRAGEYAEASEIMTKKWTGRSWPCYQPLADLRFRFSGHEQAKEYSRELDLSKAECSVRYVADGTLYTRTYLASFPDQVIAARFTASKPGALSFRAGFHCEHPTARVVTGGPRTMGLRGQAPGFVLRRKLEWVEQRGEQWKYPELWDRNGARRPFAKQVLYADEVGGRGMFFEAQLAIQAHGAEIYMQGEELVVHGADEATVMLAAATSYNGLKNSPSRAGKDPGAAVRHVLDSARRYSFTVLRRRHRQDYEALFHRVELRLGDPKGNAKRPTQERIQHFHEGADPSLAALYVQFARYLTIAGSREGTQALNLQGIWNREVIPPWASGYTTNINLEMNYWPVDSLNLSECFEPLQRLIKEASLTGAECAKSMYHRNGWVLHHDTSLWRGAQPVDNDAMPAFWNMGAAWLCEHLWQHYLYTRDREYLAQVYPLMRGSAEFLLDWLVADKDGHLVTPAGVSPENKFFYQDRDGGRKSSGVSMGPTMDIAITRQIFRNCVDASKLLAEDAPFRSKLEDAIQRLLPYKVGKQGQLQEWSIDFEETQKHHRHVSHLYGLYPDHQISAETPELQAAAQRTLELRGDEGTGWSRAWKICLWARLQDGNHAYRLVTNLIWPAKSNGAGAEQGGLMPNMFCSCPPMQIDGNFGGAAGIVEMLLQSNEKVVYLLPALPDAWPAGSFRGFRSQNGCTVSISWQHGRLTAAEVIPIKNGPVNIWYQGKRQVILGKAGKPYHLSYP